MLKRFRPSEAEVISLNLVDAFQDPSKEEVRIGRETESDFTLYARRCPLLISRYHAALRKSGASLELRDLGSTNGTYVNETKLAPHERRRLAEGDLVSFGGGLRVKVSTTTPDEDNPFVFRVKQLHRLFGGRPVITSEPQVQQATQQTAEQPAEERVTVHIDLTVSDRSPFSVSIQNRPQLRSSGSPGQPVAGPSHQSPSNQARPTPLRSGRSYAMLDSSDQPPAAKRRRVSAGPSVDLEDFSSGDEVQILQSSEPAPPLPPPPPPLLVASSPAKSIASDQPAERKPNACIEEQFECQICRELMVASHSLVPCGHMFCGSCIGEWLQKKPSCPTCRAHVTAAPVPSLTVDNMLDALAGSLLDGDSLAERKVRKEAWVAQGGRIKQRVPAAGQAWGRGGYAHPMPNHPVTAQRDLAMLQDMARIAEMMTNRAPGPVPVQPRGQAQRARGRATAVPRPVHNTVHITGLAYMDPATVAFQFQRHRSRRPCTRCSQPIVANQLAVQARYRDGMRTHRSEVYHTACIAQVRPFQAAHRERRLMTVPGAHLVGNAEWGQIAEQITFL